MLVLTFDTSCINAKQKVEELNQLEAWHKKELIKIVSSTSVVEELLQPDKEPYRTQRLRKFNKYDAEDTAYWVLGYSRLGISTKLGSESTKGEMERIADILFPNRKWHSLTHNQIRDVMALHTHWTYERDVFVTLNTNDFIGKSEVKRSRLKEIFQILVMTPKEALEYVKRNLNSG